MQLRVARHTNNLDKIVEFYTQLVGFEILGSFKDHNAYDGVFIGKVGADWHLEFTTSNEKAVHTFDADDLLVFYPQTEVEYAELLNRFSSRNIESVIPKNPYWKENGKMFMDPDGFLLVISNLRIN